MKSLTMENIRLLEAYQQERRNFTMAKKLQELFPQVAEKFTLEELEKIAKDYTQQMQTYGITEYEHLFQLYSWEVFYGPNHEQTDHEGLLLQILKQPIPALEKFEKYKAEIIQMGTASKG
jgi:hypothetical protein